VRPRTVAPATLLLLVAACGTTAPAASDRPLRHPADVTLVRTVGGVAGVTTGTDALVWRADRAVAAVDGSAVYARTPAGELARLDPDLGTVSARWPMAPGLAPVLVEPGGRRVLLSDRPLGYDSQTATRPTTRLQLRTGPDATIGPDVQLAADIEPEAFGVAQWEPSVVFVLDHRGDHYRVQRLDLATGERTDVVDRDKNPGEDMRGRPVRGVMDSRNSRLATLYVNPDDTDEPAFVHVLHLGGTTYCVDLPGVFAQGPTGSQTIERTADDVIVVRAPAADRTARFDLHTLDAPDPPPDPTVTVGAGRAPDAPYRSVPGYVAVLG
jgi:hypothetical protein